MVEQLEYRGRPGPICGELGTVLEQRVEDLRQVDVRRHPAEGVERLLDVLGPLLRLLLRFLQVIPTSLLLLVRVREEGVAVALQLGRHWDTLDLTELHEELLGQLGLHARVPLVRLRPAVCIPLERHEQIREGHLEQCLTLRRVERLREFVKQLQTRRLGHGGTTAAAGRARIGRDRREERGRLRRTLRKVEKGVDRGSLLLLQIRLVLRNDGAKSERWRKCMSERLRDIRVGQEPLPKLVHPDGATAAKGRARIRTRVPGSTQASPSFSVRLDMVDEAEQFALELVPSFARLAQAQIFTGSVRGLRHFEDQRPIPIGLKQPREHPA